MKENASHNDLQIPTWCHIESRFLHLFHSTGSQRGRRNEFVNNRMLITEEDFYFDDISIYTFLLVHGMVYSYLSVDTF